MKKFLKKKKGIILLLIAVAAAGYFFMRFRQDDSEEIKYHTLKATRGDIQSSFSVDGKMVLDTWKLKFLNSGVVKEIKVKLGDKVKKGQLLAVLDTSAEQAKIAQAQADWQAALVDSSQMAEGGIEYKIKKKIYSNAKDKLEAEDDLYDEYVDEYGKESAQALAQKVKVKAAEAEVKVAKKQLEQLQEEYKVSSYRVSKEKAAYQQARQNLTDYRIVSPVDDAVVAQINGTAGSVVINSNNNTTDPFIVLADGDNYWFEASVEDVEALKIKEGMKVYINLDAYPDDELPGKVLFVSPVAELDANDLASYKVIIELEPTEKIFLSDMMGEAKLVSQEVKDVLKIPGEALVNKGGRQYVIVRDPAGGFQEKEVQTGFTNGREVEITSGLQEGDEVVVIESSGKK